MVITLIDKRLVGNSGTYRILEKDKDEVGQMMPWPLTRHAQFASLMFGQCWTLIGGNHIHLMPLQMISHFEYLGLGVVDVSDSDLSMAFVELAPRFATVAVDYGTLMTKKIHKIIFSFTSTNISNDIFRMAVDHCICIPSGVVWFAAFDVI